MEKKYLIKEVGTDRLMLTAINRKQATELLVIARTKYPERKFYVSKRGV